MDIYVVTVGHDYEWMLYIIQAPSEEKAKEYAWKRHTSDKTTGESLLSSGYYDKDEVHLQKLTPKEGVFYEEYMGG